MTTNTSTVPTTGTLRASRSASAVNRFRAWISGSTAAPAVFARAWHWLRESFEAAGEVDARLRARRDDDSARLARSGGSPTRLF